MRDYASIKPTVYVETSVVSYLTSRLSNNALRLSRQQATRHLWDEYLDYFEFIVSDLVVTKIKLQMKEQLDTQTDPILEEYYRMKEEFNSQFNSMEELSAYLKEIEKREKARGKEYKPAPPPPPDFEKNINKMYKELGITKKQEGKVSDE